MATRTAPTTTIDAADQRRVPEADPQVEPAGQRRGDRPADRHRGQREAGHQRPGAQHALDVRRHVGRQADQRHADGDGRQVAADQHPAAEHPQRQHRLGRPPLDEHEGHQRRHGADEDDVADRCGPVPGDAALEQAEDQQREPGGEQHRTGEVELVLAPYDLLVEAAPAASSAASAAERDVDEEDPPPAEVLGEQSARASGRSPRRRPRRWRRSPAPGPAPRPSRGRRPW